MSDLLVRQFFSPQLLAVLAATICLTYLSKYPCKLIYNLFFHPLRHIPGPKLAAATRIPYVRHILGGDFAHYVNDLHIRYGEAVRVAPNEVSFISGESAWQEIYGLHPGKGKAGSFPKDLVWFSPAPNGTRSVISADNETHTRMRKAISPAFSDRAIKQQEPLFQVYIDRLIQILSDRIRLSSNGETVADMVPFYQWMIFDIVGDLTYGKPFDCLETLKTSWFAESTFSAPAGTNQLIALNHMPILKPFLSYLVPLDQKKMRVRRTEFMTEISRLTKERLERDTDRPDIVFQMNQDRGGKGLTMDEVHANLLLIMIAGSETTATMLAGTTYCLCQNAEKLKKLQDEVRGVFGKISEIDMKAVSGLKYLDAVVSEGLRIYPPVPTGFPRVVPTGGAMISDHFIPEGTSVYMSQYPACRSPRNFLNADQFVPERWLGDPLYENDKLDVAKPFSFGPRNCVGYTLAQAEMHLTLAKMAFAFDMELAQPTPDWFNQQQHILWNKKPLPVRLTKAKIS